MPIKWLKKSLQNLDDEARHIAKDDPVAARLIVKRIVDTIYLLPDNSALGRPGRIHDTRELIVPDTRYIIPYRVRPPLKLY